jgi:hypothetical protein
MDEEGRESGDGKREDLARGRLIKKEMRARGRWRDEEGGGNSERSDVRDEIWITHFTSSADTEVIRGLILYVVLALTFSNKDHA